MSPNDPRHGTYAGAVAHWLEGGRPCPACFTAETRYRKARKLKHLRGEPVTFPALGILRRIQALQALGWTGPQIADEADLSINTLRSIGYHGSGFVHWPTASKVIAVYDRLCMTRPEGHYANRGRNAARRRNYAPPLAYDDIDDPDETPTGIYQPPATPQARINEEAVKRAAAIDHAVEHGHTATRVATDLGIGRKSLLRWCQRHNRRDAWAVLAGREEECAA